MFCDGMAYVAFAKLSCENDLMACTVMSMSKRGIFVDKLNLPTRRKKTIASSPEELVLGILGERRLTHL